VVLDEVEESASRVTATDHQQISGSSTELEMENSEFRATTATVIPSGGSGGQPEPPPLAETTVDRPIAQYDPNKHVWWGEGEPAPYLHLSRAFDALTATTKRLRKQDILVNMFRALMHHNKEEVLPAVYMCSNKLASNFEGVDLGVGGSLVSSAIMQATGATGEQLRHAYK
jgi:DNA ligase-1